MSKQLSGVRYVQPADPLCLSSEAGGVGVTCALSQELGKGLMWKDTNLRLSHWKNGASWV